MTPDISFVSDVVNKINTSFIRFRMGYETRVETVCSSIGRNRKQLMEMFKPTD